MKRIKELNKGTLRLLLVIGGLVSIILGVLFGINDLVFVLPFLIFPVFFIAVRIVLWIIDGFKED
tara:strand:+ start:105 stop:299 length:195 start_codon:yes stop_codon:yes gene_type:complete